MLPLGLDVDARAAKKGLRSPKLVSPYDAGNGQDESSKPFWFQFAGGFSDPNDLQRQC